VANKVGVYIFFYIFCLYFLYLFMASTKNKSLPTRGP